MDNSWFCNRIPIISCLCMTSSLLFFFHPMCKHSVMSPCWNQGPYPIRALPRSPCGLLTMCLPALLRIGTAPWQALLISASLEPSHESAHWQLMTALLEKEDTADQQVFPHQKGQRGWTTDRAHHICLGINWVAVFSKVINLFCLVGIMHSNYR